MDGLTSLYVISILFGLVQGGIVPSYAIVVREFFPAREAGARSGVVLMATLAGMALGGWMSGAIFDMTGSLSRRVCQWRGVECLECRHRAAVAVAGAQLRGAFGGKVVVFFF